MDQVTPLYNGERSVPWRGTWSAQNGNSLDAEINRLHR